MLIDYQQPHREILIVLKIILTSLAQILKILMALLKISGVAQEIIILKVEELLQVVITPQIAILEIEN